MAHDYTLVFRARRAVMPEGTRAAAVAVRNGVIVAVKPYDARFRARETVVLSEDEMLLPGLVDTHVHVNEPGRTEWEGFATATRAAAAGGITTIIDMPLNCIPPTVNVQALEIKAKAADGQCYTDVGFWGGVVGGNVGDLHALHEAGVFGFKCFLSPSGVDEFPMVDIEQLGTAMTELRRFGARLIVHAEDATALERAPACRGRRYADFLASRPRAAENLAVSQLIELARRVGGRVHILHLSSSDALPMIAAARRAGVPMTAETCPHYLCLNAEEIPAGATQFKCCPPIREADNRKALWAGLRAGTIDCIVSDHSPSPPARKRFDVGDFGTAWGGISSLQLSLPIVWTAARQRGIPLDDVVRWMASAPARLAGLTRKGVLAPKADADLCVFAPNETFTVDPTALYHRHPVTPYAGRELAGVVRATWLRGIRVDKVPRGRVLRRGVS